MNTINIKGKEYVLVNDRVKYFRENFPDWALVTDIVEIDENHCVMKACIINPDGLIKATGYAREEKNASFINKTSFVENCETSAWGRALANMGIGIDVSIASADEVANAIRSQDAKADEKIDKEKIGVKLATEMQKKNLQVACKNLDVDVYQVMEQAGWKKGEKLTEEQYGKASVILKEISEAKNGN